MADPMIRVNGVPIFEGNRKLSLTPSPVGEVKRGVDGTLHLDVSDEPKLRLELSWDYLPGTIDGYLGRDDLRSLYEAMQPVTVRVFSAANSYRDYQMVVPPGEYRESIAFRVGGTWVWSVSLTFEEV